MHRYGSRRADRPLLRGFAFAALAFLCLAIGVGARAANPSEPPAIASLRADQTRTAGQLQEQAARLRASTTDARFRAWAMLAEAEFANDQEHAGAALQGLERTIAQADALDLPDLRYEALIRLSTILVNRGFVPLDRAPCRAVEIADAGGRLDGNAGEP